MNTTVIEQWRPVPIAPFHTSYEVSSLGRVRSLDRWRRGKGTSVAKIQGRIMRLQITNRGYVCIYLRAGSISRFIPVHRLVAMAFIPNPDGLPEVNHIDLVKTNNIVSNLEWISRLDNYLHAAAAGIMLFKRAMTDGTIRTIKELHDTGMTQGEIARRYDINQGTVSRIVWGKRRKTRSVE